MKLSDVITQLKDLKKNQESFVTQIDRKIDPDNPFIKDMAAIDTVLKFLDNLKVKELFNEIMGEN